jgi:hypothetical protein
MSFAHPPCPATLNTLHLIAHHRTFAMQQDVSGVSFMCECKKETMSPLGGVPMTLLCAQFLGLHTYVLPPCKNREHAHPMLLFVCK